MVKIIYDIEFSKWDIFYTIWIAWMIGYGCYLIATYWPEIVGDKIRFHDGIGQLFIFTMGIFTLTLGSAMLAAGITSKLTHRQWEIKRRREWV